MVETAKGLTNVEIDEQHPLLFCQGYEVIQAWLPLHQSVLTVPSHLVCLGVASKFTCFNSFLPLSTGEAIPGVPCLVLPMWDSVRLSLSVSSDLLSLRISRLYTRSQDLGFLKAGLVREEGIEYQSLVFLLCPLSPGPLPSFSSRLTPGLVLASFSSWCTSRSHYYCICCCTSCPLSVSTPNGLWLSWPHPRILSVLLPPGSPGPASTSVWVLSGASLLIHAGPLPLLLNVGRHIGMSRSWAWKKSLLKVLPLYGS